MPEMTQREVAKLLGITAASVNKTEQRALRKLRSSLELEQDWRDLADDEKQCRIYGVLRRMK